jgi:hypothetical protein
MHSALPGAGYEVKFVSLAVFHTSPGVLQPVPPPLDPLLLPLLDPLLLPLLDPLLLPLLDPLLLPLLDPLLLPLLDPLPLELVPPVQLEEVIDTLLAALKLVLSVE